jgi:hypothetical protein
LINYINYMSFCPIKKAIPPHLPPHHWCVGLNRGSINQKIFGLS